MTTDVPDNASSPWTGELRLDPQVHGKSRVPGPKMAGFSLLNFSQAVEERDLDHQATQYAPEAEMLVIDPDNPPSAPQQLHGRPAIHAWLLHTDPRRLGLRVTDLVDGGDRVAFTERWHHQDGTTAVATSTVEIDDALITMRHTILIWDDDKSPRP
jgi:hypothetical protein